MDEPAQIVCRACRKAKRTGPTGKCKQCGEPALTPDNAAVVVIFFQVRRHWKRSPRGVSIGFAWQDIKALLELLEVPHLAEITEGLMVIEDEIVAIEMAAFEKAEAKREQSD